MVFDILEVTFGPDVSKKVTILGTSLHPSYQRDVRCQNRLTDNSVSDRGVVSVCNAFSDDKPQKTYGTNRQITILLVSSPVSLDVSAFGLSYTFSPT